MKYLIPSTKTLFASSRYLALFLATGIIFILLYIGIPLYSVPSNSLDMWLAESTPLSLSIMFLTAAGLGLLLAMHVYLYRCSRTLAPKEAGAGTIATVSGFTSGLFTSATCASCVATLFSFLGFPTVLLMLQYRLELSLLSLALIAVSLHFTSRRFYMTCGVGKRA